MTRTWCCISSEILPVEEGEGYDKIPNGGNTGLMKNSSIRQEGVNRGVTIHRCMDYRDTKMPRYASRYKTAYHDSEYFLGSPKISSKYVYAKNTELYPNQNFV